MEQWLSTWWPMLWAGVISVVQIVQILLSKTYARKEELASVQSKVQEIDSRLQHMPSGEEVNRLRLELTETRGELKELRAEMRPINHLSQLLLEQRLNDEK